MSQYVKPISKIGFRFKIKADPRFEPQAYIEYVEDLKRGSNADIGLEDIFEMGYSSLVLQAGQSQHMSLRHSNRHYLRRVLSNG